MSYITHTLGEDESIQVVAYLHWIFYFYPVILLFLAILCSFLGSSMSPIFYFVSLILGFFSLYNFLELKAIKMVVTNKRIICKKGILGIKTWELKNNKVESIEVQQSLKGRLLGYATLCFSGTGTSKVYFQNIGHPWSFKKKIDLIIGKEED